MPVKGEWVRYGSQTGYLAYPERASSLPSVVVIQEIWGVESQIEDVTRRIAAAGYCALAPDLFSQKGVRPAPLTHDRILEVQQFAQTLPPAAWGDPVARQAAIDQLPESRRADVAESFAALFQTPGRLPEYVAPLREAVRYLRHERPETKDQKAGCVGFCMGGGLAALLTCEEPELSATALFYGSAPAPEKVSRIACPVLGFYGENDQRVNAGIPAFEAAMKAAGKSFEHRIYPGAHHGFFNETSRAYNVDAVRDSFARLLGFFRDTLST